MSPDIHHVPGRLRVKCMGLRNSPERARQVGTIFRAMRGVVSVQANVLTGSVIIHYRVDATTGDDLLHQLREHGFISLPQLPQPGRASAVSSLATPIAEAVAEKLVGVLIQRSAVALIGAIL